MRRIVLLAIFATAACSSSGSSDPEDEQVRNVTVTFSSDAKVPALVEGKDYRVVTEYPYTIDGKTARHYGLLKSGVSYAKLSPPASEMPTPEHPVPAIPSDTLVSFDLKTGNVTLIAAHGTDTKPAFIVDATRNDDFIVWVETSDSTYESMRWEIFSHELKTGKTRKIGSSEELGVENPPIPTRRGIRPELVGKSIYVVAVSAFDGSTVASIATAIYGAPIDGSAGLTKIVDDADDVFADGKNLRFARDGELKKWDLGKNKEVSSSVAPVDDPCGTFYNEGVLVQCDASGEVTITEKNGSQTVIKDLPVPLANFNATNRWVGFSTESQSYVYDLKRNRLGKLKGSSEFGIDRFKGARLKYAKQHQDPPFDPTIPLIELLPK
ncbi:hypothetical protein [Aeromicrobium sp.]|uniref:hypothetical protein n=1 Tax=Aeromicrobium sp. TaxID=1871063 RepID=UPI002FCB09A5